MEKVFTLSIIVSQLEEKISVLSAEVAVRSHAQEQHLNETDNVVKTIKKQQALLNSANRAVDDEAYDE